MPTCEHLDIGCCHDCAATWDLGRSQMHRDQATFSGPRRGRDIPHDREFPDSDAWIDEDGTVHYGDS